MTGTSDETAADMARRVLRVQKALGSKHATPRMREHLLDQLVLAAPLLAAHILKGNTE